MLRSLYNSLTGNTPEARRYKREQQILREANNKPSILEQTISGIQHWLQDFNATTRYAQQHQQRTREALARTQQKPHKDFVGPATSQRITVALNQTTGELVGHKESTKNFLRRANKALDDALDEPASKKISRESLEEQLVQKTTATTVVPLDKLPAGAQAYVADLYLREDPSELLINRFATYNHKTLNNLSEKDQARASKIVLEEQKHAYMGGQSPAQILKKTDKELWSRWSSARQGKKHDDEPLLTLLFSQEQTTPSKTTSYKKPALAAAAGLASVVAAATLYVSAPNVQEQPIAYEPLPETTVTSTLPEYLQQQLNLSELLTREVTPPSELLVYVPSSQEDVMQTTPFDKTSTQEANDFFFEERAPNAPTTFDVIFKQGGTLYQVLRGQGLSQKDFLASLETTAINNNWYAQTRIEEGALKAGENPLLLDSFPQAGGTYTITTVQQPLDETLYSPKKGEGVLAALRNAMGEEQFNKTGFESLVATGLANNFYSNRCVIDGEFNHEVCNPLHDIDPWLYGREYQLIKK